MGGDTNLRKGGMYMNVLRSQAIDIIQALPDVELSRALELLQDLRQGSLTEENKKGAILSKEEAWASFMRGINGFTDDFMADGRAPDYPSTREEL